MRLKGFRPVAGRVVAPPVRLELLRCWRYLSIFISVYETTSHLPFRSAPFRFCFKPVWNYDCADQLLHGYPSLFSQLLQPAVDFRVEGHHELRHKRFTPRNNYVHMALKVFLNISKD